MIAIPTVAALLLILSGLVWVVFLYRKLLKTKLLKTTPKEEVAAQFIERELPIVPYKDILKGTDGFSESNVLGQGRYGTVYRGTLENEATVVAVKVLNVR